LFEFWLHGKSAVFLSPEHRPRIALIHALAEAIEPAHVAFAEIWPEAWCWDLLDTSLSADRPALALTTDAMIERCVRLADNAANTHGQHGRTDAILFPCSAFGPGIEAAAARQAIPVLKPDQSAFEEAMTLGDEIGLVVTFAPSAAALETDLHRLAQASDRPSGSRRSWRKARSPRIGSAISPAMMR
jgi:hypothetical protein